MYNKLNGCGLVFAILTAAKVAFAVTCVQPDWNALCDYPQIAEVRCQNPDNFKALCDNTTAGCESIPGGCFGPIPSGHWYAVVDMSGVVSGRCRCGCFGEKTNFGIYHKTSGIELIQAKKSNQSENGLYTEVLGFYDSSNLVTNKINGVMYSTKSEEVIEFTFEDGSIILSTSHPVVLGDETGQITRIVTAEQVKSGDLFLSADHKPVSIKSIKKFKYDGQLVNFNVESENPVEHIVVANGLLMGDLAWQTFLHTTDARLIYRKDLMVAIDGLRGKND
jgi:hypothetical protein